MRKVWDIICWNPFASIVFYMVLGVVLFKVGELLIKHVRLAWV